LIALGAFLSFIVYYSNSIYLGIIGHFLNNFFASFFVYKYGKQDMETPRLSDSEILDAVIMIIATLVLFISVMILFYKLRFKKESVSVE